MKAKKIEDIQSTTSILIWILFIVFAYGFAYQKQYVMLAGMFALAITLVVHAPLSVITINRWQKTNAKTKLAYLGEYVFAAGQFICGVLAIAGAIADITTDYLSSGRFWQKVSEYPFLFIFCFGSFCTTVGAAQIAANLKLGEEGLVEKLGRFRDILQGIIFIIFGLFFVGLSIFVKLGSAL